MSTLVIFRKWKDTGEIIALFPEMKEERGLCNSYMHVGQHGSANYVYLVSGASARGQTALTVSTTPAEYAALLAELVQIGYDDLKVRKKWIRK